MKLQEVLSIFKEFWPLFLVTAAYAMSEADRHKTLSTYQETSQQPNARLSQRNGFVKFRKA